MATLKMNDGKEIDVLHVGRGMQYAILHIYTDAITPAEAFEIFDNRPEATKEMTVTETRHTQVQDGNEIVEKDIEDITVYSRFTEMTAVNKTRYGGDTNCIMIRMQRPFDD